MSAVSVETVSVAVRDYGFASPCLVYGGQLRVFACGEAWESNAAWLASLPQVEVPQAIILPLELSSSQQNRQDLFGYELLNTLRWSAPAAWRGLPVLLVAWQDLQAILRRKPDMLLVKPAVEFVRLPDAVAYLPVFMEHVERGRLQPASSDDIAATSGSEQQSSRVSYHDLANDYYAAYRIKKGYLALLRDGQERGITEATGELSAMSDIRFNWETYVESRLESPLVRRFQTSRLKLHAPRYPVVQDGLDILAYHLQEGLPSGTRVLLVDDEFEKGSAEILLRVLFRQSAFTKCLNDEWVYSEQKEHGSEDRWARFVCVRSAALARNWLAHWEGIDLEDVVRQSSWQRWLARWHRELSPSVKHPAQALEPEDVFAENLEFKLDRPSAGPRIKSTVVLMDLRLEPVRETLYSIKDFSSYQVRRSIKAEKPDLPVIMFTASRQVLNFAELLDSSSELDGWFIKEGPDIPANDGDANSSNSVAYLLERMHLYSTLRGWYRSSFAWDAERKLAYARLFQSKHAHILFGEVTDLADELFGRILLEARQSPFVDTETYLAYIQERVPPTAFPVTQTLVARRVALATLLWTADMTPSGPEWNTDAFVCLLPGRPARRAIKWVYDKLNFNQVLWMRSSGILSQLLREEIEWLETLDWPVEKKTAILGALARERQFIEPGR